MALTREFKELVVERVRRDAGAWSTFSPNGTACTTWTTKGSRIVWTSIIRRGASIPLQQTSPSTRWQTPLAFPSRDRHCSTSRAGKTWWPGRPRRCDCARMVCRPTALGGFTEGHWIVRPPGIPDMTVSDCPVVHPLLF